MVLFANQKKASVWKMDVDDSKTQIFAGGKGVEGSLDGKVSWNLLSLTASLSSVTDKTTPSRFAQKCPSVQVF